MSCNTMSKSYFQNVYFSKKNVQPQTPSLESSEIQEKGMIWKEIIHILELNM